MAGYRDVAAHHFAKAFADHESQSGAAKLASGGYLGLRICLKELGDLLLRHPDARVCDTKGHHVSRRSGPPDNLKSDAARFCKFGGIAEQVE